MLFADETGVVSPSPQRLAKTMAVTVVESKTDTVHLRESNDAPKVLTIEARGQRYMQIEEKCLPREKHPQHPRHYSGDDEGDEVDRPTYASNKSQRRV